MKTSFGFTLPFIALVGQTGIALADASGQGTGHGLMWHDGWGGMLFGPLLTMVVLFLLVVLVVTLVVRWFGATARTSTSNSEKGALDILRVRFARGEIDKDEFDKRRRVLGE